MCILLNATLANECGSWREIGSMGCRFDSGVYAGDWTRWTFHELTWLVNANENGLCENDDDQSKWVHWSHQRGGRCLFTNVITITNPLHSPFSSWSLQDLWTGMSPTLPRFLTSIRTHFPQKSVLLLSPESLQKCLVLHLQVLLATSTERNSCGQRRCWVGGACWACRKGLNPQFAKMSANMKGLNFAFPEMALKNERMTQLAKLTTRSHRFCALQVWMIVGRWEIDAEAADRRHLGAVNIDGRDSDRFPGPH